MTRKLSIGRLQEIRRIPASRAGRFLEEYVNFEKPVIMTGLYAGQRITGLNSVSKFRKALGDLTVDLGGSYYDTLFGNSPDRLEEYRMTLNEYFDYIESGAPARIYCREQPTPAKMKLLFRVPDIAATPAQIEPAISLMYAAKGGLVAPLHFDGDMRQVLFTQVVGKKRIYLIHPDYSARLLPFFNFSALAVQNFEEKEKQAFFAMHGAFECVLEPGETLYIPRLWWHYLENIGTTVAFNVRFGTTPLTAKLIPLTQPYTVQNLVRELIHPLSGKVRHPEVFDAMFEAYYTPHPTPQARREELERIASEAFHKYCKSAVKVLYGQAKTTHEESVVNHHFSPICFGRGRLSAACTESDLRVLKNAIKKNGVSEETLRFVRQANGIIGGEHRLTRLDCHILVNELSKGANFWKAMAKEAA